MPTNASFSRTYLSAHNNQFQQLHKIEHDAGIIAERRRRIDHLKQVPPTTHNNRHYPSLLRNVSVRQSQTPAAAPSQEGPNMATPDIEDVNRLPDSSDEEDTENAKPKPQMREQADLSQEPDSHKRPCAAVDQNRRTSKRRKLDEDNPPPSSMPEKNLAPMAEPLWLHSSSSQPRGKPQKKYRGSQQSQSSQASQESLQSTQANTGLQLPFTTRESSPRRTTKPAKIVTARDPSSSPVPEAAPYLKVPGQPSSNQHRTTSKLAPFFMPDDFVPDSDPSGKNTTDVSKDSILDTSRKRRGSSSSLSSVDSLHEHQLTGAQKRRLMNDSQDLESDALKSFPPDHIRCPMCQRPTLKTALDLPFSLPRDPSALPTSKQQKLCYIHRQRDAKTTWAEKEYPEIDWSSLPTSARLKQHICTLLPILRRKAPSFYLSSFDDAIAVARGNQSKINKYFDLTCISLVNYGYYGPRGAKIVSQAIMEDAAVSKLIGRQIRNDKAMRVAGSGRLVESVLLPEVLMRLVIEDMVLVKGEEGQEEARKILEESTEVGLLLCGDDDHVDYDGDEDDGGGY